MLKQVLRKISRRFRTSKPVTIDSIIATASGFEVAGWYDTAQVSSVSLIDISGKDVEAEIESVARPDVIQATGKHGQGFHILSAAGNDLSQFHLSIELTNGKRTSVALSGATAAVAQRLDFSPTEDVHDGLVGKLEFAVYTDKHVFVSGWLLDNNSIDSIAISDSSGKALTAKATILRYGRKDVADAFKGTLGVSSAGLAVLFELEQPGEIPAKLYVDLNVDDVTHRIKVADVFNGVSDPLTSIKRVLGPWKPGNRNHLLKADELILPVLYELFPADKLAKAQSIQFGHIPASPKASVIIPLYGRIDFMRFQLSNFNRHKSLDDYDIIYVLDDPSLRGKALRLAKEMHKILGISFRLLLLSENMGFGKANNIGVAHAKSDNLILLNSDILPSDSSWADELITVLNDKSDAGLVGARLLFEDGSMQHDGMVPMHVSEYPGLLFNDHPGKGWPVTLSPHKAELAECPLVTAACVAIKTSLYNELGGFDPAYVLGDFEDSDLCLKAIKAGKVNYIRRDTVLYHLERQSQNLVEAGDWKHKVTLLNAITFNNRWADNLAELFSLGKEVNR
ncbi:glycosyltransferase family 2 protein [Neiella sp. HB171785]|uniref:Glycosyltransferase family 2 protein n=1 Tax=Neiella litorisoli TaxID=2771431 RepID=A0A8J6QSA1_9GAMM|nr:glycosyltransferase [Neiella litorisoli]MBD1389794.1 glycosyltransferase family 2 protein [Neiella litorisoli]